MSSQYCIGLSGGIACGKSSVTSLLAARGLRIIDADDLARQAVRPGSPGLLEIIEAFGQEILLSDGKLNRGRLGDIVFSDLEKKRKLDGILHPKIWSELLLQIESSDRDQAESVAEIPLLFENGREHHFAETWAIVCPNRLQIERLCLRNGLTEEQAIRRIQSQIPNSEKRNLATRVIENAGNLEELEVSVDQALEEWRELRRKTSD